MATAVSSLRNESDANEVPVNIAVYENALKLSVQGSNKYAGLVANKTLASLLASNSVQFTATLILQRNKREKRSKKLASNDRYSPEGHLVRIVVYGRANEKVAVGYRLSESGVYLQHPFPGEYPRHLQYINPHYLLRPGARMPSLKQLSISHKSTGFISRDTLDAADKSRFMRIFDSAIGVEDTLTVQPSLRLRTTLEKCVPCPLIATILMPTLTILVINLRHWR